MATQCTPIINDSALLSAAQYRTKNKLTTVTFVDILKIIRSLNVKKVNGHDLMLIRMLTTCDAEVKKLLSLIFKTCVQCGCILKPMQNIRHCLSP